jgi:hypothetical protein
MIKRTGKQVARSKFGRHVSGSRSHASETGRLKREAKNIFFKEEQIREKKEGWKMLQTLYFLLLRGGNTDTSTAHLPMR